MIDSADRKRLEETGEVTALNLYNDIVLIQRFAMKHNCSDFLGVKQRSVNFSTLNSS